MRVVIAMDKFKGTLTAAQASRAVADGLRDVMPGIEVDLIPIADGGEGTTDAVQMALGGELRHIAVPNATASALVEAPVLFVERGGGKVAVMEMSAAAGLEHLQENAYDPVIASTFSVGQMLIYAGEQGAREIVIGIGGSATNDGGSGMATAYGYKFEDADSRSVTHLPRDLERVSSVHRPDHFVTPKITVACDVTNPLLGSNGATYIYAQQKGARPDQLPALEARMRHLADLVEKDLGCDYRQAPGAGAAGGLGYGLMTFLGATLQPGFPLLAGLLRIEARIADADAVITGEGSLDAQTCSGKAPMGVAEIARRHGKTTAAIGGKVDKNAVGQLFDQTFSLVNASTDSQRAMATARVVLRERSREAGKWLNAVMNSR